MRPRLRFATFFASTLVCALVTFASCAPPAQDLLATYRGGELRISDLDIFIRSLPEARRAAPAASQQQWLEDLLRALAAERLQQEAIARDEDQLAALELRRRWSTAGLLAAAMTAELGAAVAIDQQELAARFESLGTDAFQAGGGALLNFRHIFLRLDRAGNADERRTIEERGKALAARARAGEDFAELARQESDSHDSADGGLVENQRPGLLEETARGALEALAEGEISPLIETRTGLHLFRLERRLETPPLRREQRENMVRSQLTRQTAAADRRQLIAELRSKATIETETFPWRVGTWELLQGDVEMLLAMPAATVGEAQRQQVVELLLLAEEGRRRGLLTAEIEQRAEAPLAQEMRQLAFAQRRERLVAALPAERVRSVYDARPSAFASRELAHLELIFVGQGHDPFATQRRLEDHVAKLGAGASFAELASEISTGPNAAEGGDLGLLPPAEWARLNPQIYSAVVALSGGEISDPIHCTARIMSKDPRTLRGGFAIVRVREKRPPRQRTFEEALDDVRIAYSEQNAAELALEVRDGLLSEADFRLIRVPDLAELAK